jgi:ribose transport system permease protein
VRTASLRTGARRVGTVTVRRVFAGRYSSVLLGLAAVFTFLAIKVPVFLTWANWQNIFRVQAVVFIVAIGSTFVVLTGGLDLSVGSTAAASGMLVGIGVEHGWPWGLAALTAVGVGLALGLLNGVGVAVLKIPFFIVTIGTLSIYQSVALLLTSGKTISFFQFPHAIPLQNFVNGSVGPFPTLLVLSVALAVIGGFVLHFTAFGRSVYAIGSNRRAAHLSGVRTTLVLAVVYTLAGALAGLGAVVQSGRLSASAPQVDPDLLFSALAAVLIGGTSFDGGDGGLLGTAIGALFIGVIQNGISLLEIATFWQGIVSGLILVIAVGLGAARGQGLRLRVAAVRPFASRTVATTLGGR